MSLGEAVAIGFAAGSALTLLITIYMIREASKKKLDEVAGVLGVRRDTVAKLESEGQLPGALGVGQPATISSKALETLLECKRKAST